MFGRIIDMPLKLANNIETYFEVCLSSHALPRLLPLLSQIDFLRNK